MLFFIVIYGFIFRTYNPQLWKTFPSKCQVYVFKLF